MTAQCTAALEAYDHALALETTERFFWQFCDDYLELVKPRAYAGDGSALGTLRAALSVVLRLFAPFLPFVTEEVWSWFNDGSIHKETWPGAARPSTDAIAAAAERRDDTALDLASDAIAAIRKSKSQAGLSQKTDVAEFVVAGPKSALDVLATVLPDVAAAGRVARAELKHAEQLKITYEVRL